MKVMIGRKNAVLRLRVVFFIMLTLVVVISVIVTTFFMNSQKIDIVSMAKMKIALEDISFNELYYGDKGTKYYNNRLTIENNGLVEEFDGVRISGHGNFSWLADKKSYTIKFGSRVDLLNMGKARKWVLVSNGADKSLLRNDVAFFLERLINERNALIGDFVELSIDGNDLGIYFVTKSLAANKDVVGLDDQYGILVEYDGVYGWDNEDFYETWDGGLLDVKDAIVEENAEIALRAFGSKFDDLEKAAWAHDYEAANDVADFRSLAEYYLLSEFSGNPDAYYTSYYFYSDGIDDKIHAGPGWDFDAAFGNRNWESWDDNFYSPTSLSVRKKYAFGENRLKISRILYNLAEMPEFYELVCEVYKEKLMGKEDEILDYIDERMLDIETVAEKEDELWGNDNFVEEVEYLKWWISVRFEIFDELYGKRTLQI